MVRAGETLSGIAAEHNVSLSSVFALNGMNGGTVIHPGQNIKVGGRPSQLPAVDRHSAPAKPASGGELRHQGRRHVVGHRRQAQRQPDSLAAANGIGANGTILRRQDTDHPGR